MTKRRCVDCDWYESQAPKDYEGVCHLNPRGKHVFSGWWCSQFRSKGVQAIARPCFELYDERNQYKIEQCCEGKPDAADICNHIRRGGTYLDCRSGRRSDYYDVVPVNAPSEIVDESQEIERLKADRDHWKQSATFKTTELNGLKAELTALREPIYTVAKNGMPKEDGWYWAERLDLGWGVDWWESNSSGGCFHVFNKSHVIRYQRIRPPEVEK